MRRVVGALVALALVAAGVATWIVVRLNEHQSELGRMSDRLAVAEDQLHRATSQPPPSSIGPAPPGVRFAPTGSEPASLEWCTGDPQRFGVLGIEGVDAEIPDEITASEDRVLFLRDELPELFEEACSEVLSRVNEDPRGSFATSLLELAEATGVAERATQFLRESLGDTRYAWCLQHMDDVFTTSSVLGFNAPEQRQGSPAPVLVWIYANPDAYVQVCQVAYTNR